MASALRPSKQEYSGNEQQRGRLAQRMFNGRKETDNVVESIGVIDVAFHRAVKSHFRKRRRYIIMDPT